MDKTGNLSGMQPVSGYVSIEIAISSSIVWPIGEELDRRKLKGRLDSGNTGKFLFDKAKTRCKKKKKNIQTWNN